MEKDPQFEQIREEIEAKQRAILWTDGLRAGKSVDELLWKGDPKAKPVQRAGMIVFAVFFWFMGVFIIAESYARSEDDIFGQSLGVLMGSIGVIISIRLFFNAFRRQEKPLKH
jgi:hypothetical protein